MRFKSFIFPSLPTKIRLTHSANLQEEILADGSLFIENISDGAVITAEGIFSGEHMCESFRELSGLVGISGELTLPYGISCFGTLKEVSLISCAEPDRLSYSLIFIQQKSTEGQPKITGRIFAHEGESLFHVANRLNLNIESLREINPHISTPTYLEEHQEVFIYDSGAYVL